MKKFPVSKVINEFSKVFTNNNFSLYIVGGAIRDYLLGKENTDYDFCTDALPEEVMSMFKTVIPTGLKHGTVTVLFKGNSFEVTTFRTETDYSDKRHPDSVKFVRSLNEDLSRRDFTVNAFAASCETGEIIDLFNGEEDLKSEIIRAIGNAEERFGEDALRLMRMCRFCSKLNFKPEEKTFEAAKKLSATINYVSKERIFDEISKTLMTKKPSVGFCLMEETGLLEEVLPELDKCKEIEQTKVGSSNVFGHIMNTIDATAFYNREFIVRFSALLHDIGKPACMKKEGDFIRFYGHDIKSAEVAKEVTKRLKCSNQMIEDTYVLIANHMVKYRSNWTDGAVKRFINRIGKERINLLFELQWADQIASEGKSKIEEYDEFIQRIRDVQNQPMSLKDLAVSGNDLASIGIAKSKKMGEILNKLLDMVIDYPTLNNKETLLKQAQLLNNI